MPECEEQKKVKSSGTQSIASAGKSCTLAMSGPGLVVCLLCAYELCREMPHYGEGNGEGEGEGKVPTPTASRRRACLCQILAQSSIVEAGRQRTQPTALCACASSGMNRDMSVA